MANVIDFLKQFRENRQTGSENNPERTDYKGILDMTLDQFARESVAILVKSYLLGEDIMLVSNPRCLSKVGDEFVTYLPEELEALCKLSPEMIKRVHWLKKKTDGEIVKDIVSCQNRG